MTNLTKIIAEDYDGVLKELGNLIETISKNAIASRDVFNVGVSGGSLIQMLEKCLSKLETDWSKWRIYFCDERVVPFDSPDSTYGLYVKALEGKVSIKQEQFVTIQQGLSASDAAVDYEKKLKENFGGGQIPRFDLLLLGVGPDGHICSLFPGHALLGEAQAWVAAITDSPKPPPARVTLTLPVINNASNCVFPISGKGKASILKSVLEDGKDLPAAMVNPTAGKVYWIVDKDAASELKKI